MFYEQNLLGALVDDSFVNDDPSNACGSGKFPTLVAVHNILEKPRPNPAPALPHPNPGSSSCSATCTNGQTVC